MNGILLQRQNAELRKAVDGLRQENLALKKEVLAHREILANVRLNFLQRWRLKRVFKKVQAGAPA